MEPEPVVERLPEWQEKRLKAIASKTISFNQMVDEASALLKVSNLEAMKYLFPYLTEDVEICEPPKRKLYEPSVPGRVLPPPGKLVLPQITGKRPFSLPAKLPAKLPTRPISPRAEVPTRPISPPAELPTRPISPPAKLPTRPISPPAKLLTRPISLPTRPISPRAEVPTRPISPRAEVPTRPISLRVGIPTQPISPPAKLPTRPVSLPAKLPTRPVSLRGLPQIGGPTPPGGITLPPPTGELPTLGLPQPISRKVISRPISERTLAQLPLIEAQLPPKLPVKGLPRVTTPPVSREIPTLPPTEKINKEMIRKILLSNTIPTDPIKLVAEPLEITREEAKQLLEIVLQEQIESLAQDLALDTALDKYTLMVKIRNSMCP